MSDWIVFTLAASQIIVMYFLCPHTYLRLIDIGIFGKNPAWVAAHPEFRQRYQAPAALTWLYYAAGAAWIAYLLATWQDAPPRQRFMLSVLPGIVWLLLTGAYAGVATKRTAPRIPLPERRRASLQRRALRDFVAPVISHLGFGLYAAALATYAAAWQLGSVPGAIAGARMIGATGILVITAPILLYTLRRKDQAIDEIWGPMARKFEVWFNMLVLYGGLVVIAMRVLQDFAGIRLINELTFAASVNLVAQIVFVTFLLNPVTKRILNGEKHA